MADGNARGGDLAEGLGGDLHVAEERDLGNVDHLEPLEHLAGLLDGQLVAALAEHRPLLLDVERQGVIAGGHQAADLPVGGRGLDGGIRPAEQPRLIRQADADQRTPRALGAIVQWRRHHALRRHIAELPNKLTRAVHQLVGKGDRDPAPRLDEVQDAPFAQVAAFAKNQPLGTELHLLGLPGIARHVGHVPALVVHRDRGAGCQVHQVDLGDQALAGGGEHERAGMDRLDGRVRGFGLRVQGLGAVVSLSLWGRAGVRAVSSLAPRLSSLSPPFSPRLGHLGPGGRIDAAVRRSGLRAFRGCRRTRPGPIRDRPVGDNRRTR